MYLCVYSHRGQKRGSDLELVLLVVVYGYLCVCSL